MRMLDLDRDYAVTNLILYLTESETKILKGYLAQLLDFPGSTHFHANSKDYTHELTVTLVREDQLNEYDERSRQLWKSTP